MTLLFHKFIYKKKKLSIKRNIRKKKRQNKNKFWLEK